MKNRVKGLLALCLAMCMVLAMTTVAFADGTVYYYYYYYYADTLNNWTVLQPGDTVSASCGMFFVVDESNNYMANVNTNENGANRTASSSGSNNNADRPYFADGSKLDVSKLDSNYTYSVKKVTVPDGKAIYRFVGESESRLFTAALMLKAVPKTYTVIFDTNGGSELADKTVEYGGAVLSGVTAPTKAGYTFAGWKYGDLEVADDTLYSDLAADTVASITLVAQWEGSSGHEPIRRQHVATVVEPVTEPVTETTTVDSPKTFDAGIAVYGVSALLSLTGSAWVVTRRRDR